MSYLQFFLLFINLLDVKGKERIFYLVNKCFNKNFFYCQYCPFKKNYEYGVSICITAYKSVKFIEKTLNSIANQTWFINHNNYEIILGIDGCTETLQFVKNIKNNYKNLILIMMKENKGTYITTNTIMTISKYDHLIRFDSDDIMYPNLVEKVMTQNTKYDMVWFKMKNYDLLTKKTSTEHAYGQFMMKHWVFDYFGGFRPWSCSADEEFKERVYKYINILNLNEILLLRQIHPNSLTQSNKTNFFSKVRKNNLLYIRQITSNIINCKEAKIEKIVYDYYEIK